MLTGKSDRKLLGLFVFGKIFHTTVQPLNRGSLLGWSRIGVPKKSLSGSWRFLICAVMDFSWKDVGLIHCALLVAPFNLLSELGELALCTVIKALLLGSTSLLRLKARGSRCVFVTSGCIFVGEALRLEEEAVSSDFFFGRRLLATVTPALSQLKLQRVVSEYS